MKKSILVMAAVFAFSGIAQAEGKREGHKDGPCMRVVAACEAAGFVKGAHKKNGKGLYADCMQKLVKGEAVAGVNVPAEDVAACRAKKEEHRAKKGQ